MRWPWQKRRKRWGSDQEALEGDDPINSAARWARHVYEREFPDNKIISAVMVVDTVGPAGPTPFYTTSDMSMSPALIYGLLNLGIELARQSAEQQRIEGIINVVTAQLVDHFEDRFSEEAPSRAEVKAVAEGLLDGPARRIPPEGRIVGKAGDMGMG